MMSLRYLLVPLLLFGLSAAEDVTEVVTDIPTSIEPTELVTEPGTTAITNGDHDLDADKGIQVPELLPDAVDVSDVICNPYDFLYKVCNCTGDRVDCRNLNLWSLFEDEDWSGLHKLGVQDMTNVDLSGNHFVAISEFPTLPIRSLNISNCEIEILKDGAFSNLKYLSTLDLSRNKLSFVSVKRAFLGFSANGLKPTPFLYLQHLSLAYNDIHSLFQDVFKYIPHLTFLDLSGNSLVSIDQVTMGAIVTLLKLRELRFSECDLEYLPKGIFRRLRLQRLDLSGNRLTEVPSPLNEALNLRYLNLNRNPIESISERTSISNLTRLQELHLSRLSKLRSVAHGALGGLVNLVRLHMSFNARLTDLHPKFLEWEDDLGLERWPLLEELYLNNNNISSIDSRILDRWDHLTHVDFSSNPYVCDCNSQWMVNVLVPLIAGMANATTARMICRRPYDFRGLSFAQLYESHKKLPCALTELATSDDTVGMETAVMYGVLVGVLIAFPLVLVVVILWKKGCFARCRNQMTSKKDYYDDEETDAF